MRNLLRRNLGLKLLSLLLAYLAWAVVVGRPQKPIVHEIPVVFRAGANALVVGYDPKNIKVQLTGDPGTLKPEVLQGLFAEVDASRLVPGEQQVPVGPADVRNVPGDVTVEVIDDLVTLNLERRTARAVTVNLSLKGSPPEGFVVGSIRTEPETVSAVGAKSRVETLESVSTELLDLDGRTAPFVESLTLLPGGGNVYFDPPSVRVSVEIREVREERIVELAIGGVPSGWVVRPAEVTATIAAPASRAADVVAAAAATIALAGAPPTAGPVRVSIDFPGLPRDLAERAEVRAVAPPEVRLERAGPRR